MKCLVTRAAVVIGGHEYHVDRSAKAVKQVMRLNIDQENADIGKIEQALALLLPDGQAQRLEESLSFADYVQAVGTILAAATGNGEEASPSAVDDAQAARFPEADV